jgi:hypothetical protein
MVLGTQKAPQPLSEAPPVQDAPRERKTKAKVPRAPKTKASKSSKASKALSAQKEPQRKSLQLKSPPAREPMALEPPALASTPPANTALSEQEGNHSDDEIPSR